MYYELEVRSHVRVPPSKFKDDTEESILKSLNETFDAFVSKEIGAIIGVTEILEIGEGVIIPGDGAAYYNTRFKILTFKPEIQEIILGKVNDITEFGAFMNMGAMDGMVHVSQTMDDFVSYNKSNALTGKESKRILKVGDKCRARIIAVSFKEIANPKIGLTMRQPGLGSMTWVDEEAAKSKKEDAVEKGEEKKKGKEK